MTKRALIGLGQSGSAIVEDIISMEMLEKTEFFCINSYKNNITFSKNIPKKNWFMFDLDSGFSQEPKSCFDFLEQENELREKMISWVKNILEEFEEVLLITFSPSGTGLGTLSTILNSNIRIAKKAIVIENSDSSFYQEKFHENRKWIEGISSEFDTLTFISFDAEKELKIKEKLGYKLDFANMRYTLINELVNNKNHNFN